MVQYVKTLLKEGKPTPFVKNIKHLQVVQAKNYSQSDILLPEDQWAQLTCKLKIEEDDEGRNLQYVVFERRQADKLSFLDWKLSYIIDEDDFKFLHSKGNPRGLSKKAEEAKKEAAK